jgi:hypothetical protein
MSLEQKVQQWVQLDTQLKQYGEKARELREKKQALTEQILEAKTETVSLPLNVKVVETRVAESLTFKYLEKTLSQIIKNQDQVKTIIEFVKKNREIKVATELKR